MTAFIAYDGRHPVNLDLVRYIELDEDIAGNRDLFLLRRRLLGALGVRYRRGTRLRL